MDNIEVFFELICKLFPYCDSRCVVHACMEDCNICMQNATAE